MNITLNGKPFPLTQEISLSQLLESLGLHDKPVIAELNEIAILPRLYPQTIIRSGDRLELVTLAAGG